MAKNTKQSAGSNVKPITAFFVRNSKAPSEDVSLQSPSAQRSTSCQHASSNIPTQTPSSSRKRSPSPDAPSTGNSIDVAFPKSSKGNFEKDSDRNAPKHLKKKARLSSPDQQDDHLVDFTLTVNKEITSEHFFSKHGTESRLPSASINEVNPMEIDTDKNPTVALDSESKTAKIIAEIRERAYAKSLSSPEPALFEFHTDLEESSDDDSLPLLPLVFKNDTSNKNHGASANIEPRYSLRSRSPMSYANASQLRTSLPTIKHQKKSLNANPFDSLLKEKNIADKRGKGDGAFHLAELTTSKFRATNLIDEPEKELDELSGGEVTPLLLIDQLEVPTIDFNHNLGEDEVNGSNMFANPKGRTILDILNHDKAAEVQAEASKKVIGIRFWLKDPVSGNSRTEPVVDQFPGRSPIIHTLNACLRRNDYARAQILLGMDILSIIDVRDRRGISSYFSSLALSAQLHVLSDIAGEALEKFWSSSKEPKSSGISFAEILTAVHRLGADPSITQSQKWMVDSCIVLPDVSALYNRETVVRRLVLLTGSCARSGRLQARELPDIILMLLLIGMDVDASPTLVQQVSRLVDLVCQSLYSESSSEMQIETSLCSKVLGFIGTQEPINKARLLSFFSSGSGPTRRIAGVMAYCIITEKEISDFEMCCDVPPLSNIVDQLVPYSKPSSNPRGKFSLHDRTDYVNLSFYITILAISVSNLRRYVAKERQSQAQKTVQSPKKGCKTNLQLLHSALETLHANISDTRATQLERSRAKATIKALAMNVHYQREVWLRNDSDAKSKTLPGYFQKKEKINH